MSGLLDAVEEVLTGDGWQLFPLTDGVGLSTTVRADGATWPFVALVDDEEEVVVCYSVLPRRVPPESRPAVSELLTRTNYGLLVGAFEIDLDDGEVRLRTTLDTAGHNPEPDQIRAVVGRNVAMAERHFPEVLSLLGSE